MRRHNECSGPPAARLRGRRPRPALTVVTALGIAALAASGCGSSAGDAPTSADAAAARGLSRAASAMRRASGYRFAATIGSSPAQVQLHGEFQAPDRVHETVVVAGQPAAEVIFLGRNAFVKDPKTGAWRNRVQTAATTSTDVRVAFTALTRAQNITRQGATYRFAVPAAAARALVGSTPADAIVGSAHLSGEQIDTLTYHATISGHAITVRIEFTDLNRAPPVEQPAVT
jgi:hypothetical protein